MTDQSRSKNLIESRKPSFIIDNTTFATATTAVNLETVRKSSIDATEGLEPEELANQSFLSSVDSQANGTEDRPDDSYNESYIHENEEDLQNLLNGLMRSHKIHQHHDLPSKLSSFVGFNVDNCPGGITDETEFYNKFIKIDKSGDADSFHCKLKHFFILSSAGKPIYSLHGADDIIMGYMGIITTIVSTFEENMKEEIKSITLDNRVKIVALNKSPIILVTISKIEYEFNKESTGDDAILISQLNTLYDYLLSILSKPVLEKNFYKRLNYDLRKVLTPLDFHNLDSICMKSTYGVFRENDRSSFDFFISELLNSSLQNVMLTNTTRTKLNSILVSCKKLKRIQEDTAKGNLPFFNSPPSEKYIADELLFSLLMSSNKLLNFVKPRNHNLSNRDLKMLFSMINSTLESTPTASAQSSLDDFKMNEDLWIPLCLPNFNPNGFLYIFVKKFKLSDYPEPISLSTPSSTTQQAPSMVIILISGSKNAFFDMQTLAGYIIGELTKKESFKLKLNKELLAANKLLIYKDLKVPVANHFIYKLKKEDQFIMSDACQFNGLTDLNVFLQLSYFYSVLHNTRAVKLLGNPGLEELENKKLTYINWSNQVVGFMLSDDVFEFYCLCNAPGGVNSKELIMSGLKIIRWCEKNYRRLVIGKGVVF